MESRIVQATERHNRGYNCAQAVACTYADLVGVDEDLMFRLTEGLGLGGGSMEGTCGALAGAQIILSMRSSSGNLEHPDSKQATYKRDRALDARFKELTGAVLCRDIKGVGTGQVLCPCPGCVVNGARVVEELVLPDLFAHEGEGGVA